MKPYIESQNIHCATFCVCVFLVLCCCRRQPENPALPFALLFRVRIPLLFSLALGFLWFLPKPLTSRLPAMFVCFVRKMYSFALDGHFCHNGRMLTTPHTAAGIALGVALGNPAFVVPAAVTSHFLLDCVPHWQETLAPYNPTWKTYVRVPIDIALAVGITIFAAHAAPQHAVVIWAGAVAANVPDFDSLVVLVPNIKRGVIQKFWDWHCAIQCETSSLWGLIPQLVVVASAVAVVTIS